MIFNGTSDPVAYIRVGCIGGINNDANNKGSQAIGELVQEIYGVPIDRFYLEFLDSSAENIGWNGKTFATK